MNVTKAEIIAGLKMMAAVGGAIQEAGEIPAGKLYAVLMDRMDVATFDKMIATLAGAGLVERTPLHLLRWIGPAFQPAGTEVSKPWTEHLPERP